MKTTIESIQHVMEKRLARGATQKNIRKYILRLQKTWKHNKSISSYLKNWERAFPLREAAQ